MASPISVLYGGAHRFAVDVVGKLGGLAQKAFASWAPDPSHLGRLVGEPLDPALAEALFTRVTARLASAPLDDYRIDFEDGFGARSDADEDHFADLAAQTLFSMTVWPRWIGLRTRPSLPRAERTLLRTLAKVAPRPFRVTLPKVETVKQVDDFVKLLDDSERRLGWPDGSLALELMIESRLAEPILPALCAAAEPRLIGLHLGAYDYTASLGVPAAAQGLDHPACVALRHAMQLAAPPGVAVVDGATTLLPLAGQELAAARQHARNIARALASGITEGWDLHPAQLPIRYLATFLFFRRALPDATARLRRFLEAEAVATRVGAQFDDAATVAGLRNFSAQAVASGAVDDGEVSALLASETKHA